MRVTEVRRVIRKVACISSIGTRAPKSSGGCPRILSTTDCRRKAFVLIGMPTTRIPGPKTFSCVAAPSLCGVSERSSMVMSPATSVFNLPRLSCTPSRARHSLSHNVTLGMAAVSRALPGERMTVIPSIDARARAPGTGGSARKSHIILKAFSV